MWSNFGEHEKVIKTQLIFKYSPLYYCCCCCFCCRCMRRIKNCFPFKKYSLIPLENIELLLLPLMLMLMMMMMENHIRKGEWKNEMKIVDIDADCDCVFHFMPLTQLFVSQSNALSLWKENPSFYSDKRSIGVVLCSVDW